MTVNMDKVTYQMYLVHSQLNQRLFATQHNVQSTAGEETACAVVQLCYVTTHCG